MTILQRGGVLYFLIVSFHNDFVNFLNICIVIYKQVRYCKWNDKGDGNGIKFYLIRKSGGYDLNFVGVIALFKKILPTVVTIFLIFFGNVSAQEVTVIGMGTDKNDALRDASRLAVEQVIGTYIDSRTLMKDLIIQLDEVYKKSQGYIKNIQILNEEKVNNSLYRVQAKIDVDTTPDGKLIDEITMLLQLNDPRIAVLVFKTENGNSVRNEIAEGILNEKLIAMNFSHVLNSSMVARLNNAALLGNLALSGTFSGSQDNAADYLVLVKYRSSSNPVKVPTYDGLQYTDFHNGKTELKVEIIKYDTGEIIGTFTINGSAVANDTENAKNDSTTKAATAAAEKLAETFKKFSSKVTQSLTFTITATNDSKLQQIINELRSLGIVDGVYIREQKKNRAVLSVDSSQKPNTIVTALKGRTVLKIEVESVTNSACKLKVR